MDGHADPGMVAWEQSGQDALWSWFGLSYASWLTLPRVLMHHMPDEWQGRMAALLHEYDEHWNNVPEDAGETVVGIRKRGRMAPMPDWVQYRHPLPIIHMFHKEPQA